MKKWVSCGAKLALVLVMLSMFSTLAFAKKEMTVQSVRLEDGVEVEWSSLQEFEGMDVWCATYDKHGRLLTIGQADMNGEACRLKCNPNQVAYVKIFLLGEDIKPAEDVTIPGQKYEPNKQETHQEHLHVWELQTVKQPNGYFEQGEGDFSCACGETLTRPIPAQADPKERELKAKAQAAGLLNHLDLKDMGEATRLDVAKLVAAYADLDVQSTADCDFTDCGDLRDPEKGVINAVARAELVRGTGNGEFHPYSPVTRSEFILILMNCLGNPECDWDVPCTGVPQWNEYDANTLFNLGILGDDPNLRGEDKLTKADALQWMVNGKEWEKNKPSDPVYEITNAHFVLENGVAPNIFFTVPAAATGDEEYVLYVRENGGAWDDAWWTRDSWVVASRLNPGNYDLRIATVVNGTMVAWVDLDLKLSSTAGAPSNAVAAFRETTHNGQKAYDFDVTGGTPNVGAMLFVREQGYGTVRNCRFLNANGAMNGTIAGTHGVSHVENGEYMIREFENLTVSPDGKTCSFVAHDTPYRLCNPQSSPSDPAYAVTDVRFDIFGGGISLLFNGPQSISGTGNVTYELSMTNTGNGRHYGRSGDYNAREDQNFFFLGGYDHGVYEDMVIETFVDGQRKAWVELDGYCLNIENVGDSDARAEFTFSGDSENKVYDYAVTGTSNAQFMISMLDDSGSARHFATLDANGEYRRTGESGSHTVAHIENGNCFIREYDALNFSADGKTCEALYRDSITWKCLRGYGYVTADPERVMDGGDKVDEITFWDGEETLRIRTKSQFAGVLAKGDVFSYRLELRNDDTYRLDEIRKGAEIDGKAIAVGFTTTNRFKWIKVDAVKYDLAGNYVISYVDTDLVEGVLPDDVVLGRNVKCFLNQNGQINAIFVDVNEDAV